MTDDPVDLDTHRGMAAQKATDLRRVLAEAERHSELVREREAQIETQLIETLATTWPEAAAKARYVLNLYATSLGPQDSRHRDLIAAVLADFSRLTQQSD
ncbi:hypothetical protein [Bradyrhizobium sp. SYSU BS000235]|uniref:hypothetical protein n=1 Tax=Bradyrhizobium sp. SYSU BS000235 TaxID=3411332 RepID=UPI003C729A9C